MVYFITAKPRDKSTMKEGDGGMKILIVVRNSPTQSYLFTVTTRAVANEIHDQVRKGKHSKAIDTVFRKGVFEREVHRKDISDTKAKLILSDYNASWDLMKQ